MDCRTCELLKEIKQFRREMNKEWKSRGLLPLRNKFTAAIIDRSGRGRMTYFTNGNRRRIPLNYCPECGRQIKNRKGTHENDGTKKKI